MAVDAAGDSLMDAATQPIADDDGEGDDEESPLTHASRAVHAAEGVDGAQGALQREDLHARSEALRDAAIAAEALKAATTSTEVLPLSGPNPYAIAAAASASNPVSASGPLSLPVNARKQRERLESPEKKHRTDKKKIETGAKFPGGDLKPHLFLEGEDQGGLMLRPRQLPMTPSLSDIPKFSTLTPHLPRLFRVGLEIFGTCLLEVRRRSCRNCIPTKHISPQFRTRFKIWIRNRRTSAKLKGTWLLGSTTWKLKLGISKPDHVL